MCVGVCAGAGAGVGGTRSSGTAVGPARPRDPRSARPKIACSVPDGEDLVLKNKQNKPRDLRDFSRSCATYFCWLW